MGRDLRDSDLTVADLLELADQIPEDVIEDRSRGTNHHEYLVRRFAKWA